MYEESSFLQPLVAAAKRFCNVMIRLMVSIHCVNFLFMTSTLGFGECFIKSKQ